MTSTIRSIFAWDGSLTDSGCKRPLRSSIAVSVRVRSRVFLRRSGEDATAATKTLHHQILSFDKITIGKHTDIPTRTSDLDPQGKIPLVVEVSVEVKRVMQIPALLHIHTSQEVTSMRVQMQTEWNKEARNA